MQLSGNRYRTLAWSIAALGGLFLLVGLSATPALAHGGEGEIEVGATELVGPLEVEFPIRITYLADGHPAEEVSGMSVSGKSADGATLDPIDPFTPGDAPGVYVARLTLPAEGSWVLTIDVAEPPSTASVTVEVTDDGDGPDGDDTTTTSDSTPPDAPSDTAPSDPEATIGEVSAPVDASDTSADDDGSFPIVVVAVAVVAAAAIGWVAYTRTRSRPDAGA